MSVLHPRDVTSAVPSKHWSHRKGKPWCVEVKGNGETGYVGEFRTRALAQTEADHILEYADSVKPASVDGRGTDDG